MYRGLHGCADRLPYSTGRDAAAIANTAASLNRMKLWRRLLGGREPLPPDVAAWRQDWTKAAAQSPLTTDVVERLRLRLDQLSSSDDFEIELEMLDALERAAALHACLAERGLPVVETGHRVVGTDTCHFLAPASIPDDPAQPSGRLLLTNARIIFAGGARTVTAPWHAMTRPTQTERDLVLVRVDASAIHRFRLNSYGDALCAAIIARDLVRR